MIRERCITGLSSLQDITAYAVDIGSILTVIGWIAAAAAAGIAFAGVFHALRCFIYAFIIIRNDIKIKAESTRLGRDDIPRSDDGSLKFYEDIAVPGLFDKRMLRDLISGISAAWRNIGKATREFVSNINYAEKHKKIGAFVIYSIMIVSTSVFGGIASAGATLLLLLGYLAFILVYSLFYLLCIGAERVFFSVKGISYRCDFCKEAYKLPVYICPVCGIPHRALRPSKFGIFHRKCTCGEILPATPFTMTSDKRRRSELAAQCPKCGRMDKAELSRPLGIALIGGVAVGKTTFKTAFLCKFINEDAVRFNIDVSFPDKDTEYSFEEIEKSYKGMRPITATKPGQEYDVVSFNFFIDHEKFDVRRYIHLYDMPGEVFETNNSKERLKHFAFSEGVIFMIDPYSMQSVIDNSDGIGKMSVGHMDIDLLVQVFLETLEGLQGIRKEGGKYILPVAVAIGKVDTTQLKSLIGFPAAAKLQKHDPETYADKYDTMDYLCRSFLIANDKSNAVMLLDQNFRHIHFFSCTSMGYVPKDTVVRFTPENVNAVVRWILTRSDSRLNSVWHDEPIGDITEKHKKLWAEHSGDYAKYIESDFKLDD